MTVDLALQSPMIHSPSDKDLKALRFIEEMTRNVDFVQRKVIKEILSRNSETEYLKRYGLKGFNDRKTFKTNVPVIKYEDLKPEIQRIANGDRSMILSSHPITEFLTRYKLFYYFLYFIMFFSHKNYTYNVN